MSPLCQQYTDEWDLLALDALEAGRVLELRAHLATGCSVCRQRYGESLTASRALAFSAPEAQPSAEVERLLRGRLQRNAVARPARVYWQWAVAAASLILAGWLAWDRAQMSERLAEVRPQPKVEAVRPPEPLPTVAMAPAAPPASNDSALAAMRTELSRLQESLRQAEESGRAAREELQREQARWEAASAEAMEKARRAEQSLREAESRVASAAVAPVPPVAPAQLAPSQLALVQTELAAARRAVDTQGKQIAEYRRVFRALEGSALRQVDMQSVDPGGGRATARAVISSEGLLVFARDLPKLPPEKCYQLWIVRRGGPAIVSGGLLQTDAQGRGVLVAGSSENLKGATGFAITDEPQGGSASAQGKKLLFGAF